ncbi:glycosyltransferase family 2 protein [Mesorhizobium sp. SP-1A]|uniref:glycosyltransferase n=1 Tax=Mesorhizobium sp. SP-1A TaxID=3077840 RepID=UPI0028F70D35|nr:glycosyltransferase family 2 protein [Mesorhizobium sp. SP-1A]
MAMRLSVIIPHLNEPDDLRRCLQSLEAQKCDGIEHEVIVVDNGSRTLPAEVCAAFPGVRLEREPTPGPGPARNRGAAVAHAELLAFIDCDCVAGPGWMAALVGFLDAHPEIGFVGGDIRITPTDAARLTAIEAYESVFSYRARYYVEHHKFTATGNMAVRASVFRAVGPFGGLSSMEDTEWGQKASALGHGIGYVDEAKVRTPSCKSFAELARRWDRHVAHEFRQVRDRPGKLALWAAGSVLVAASPLREIPRVLRSDRLARPLDRCKALACLTRVRLYRARRMLSLALSGNAAALVGVWNREPS